MASSSLRTGAVVALDVALLAVCLLHLPSVLDRPDVPFKVEGRESGVAVDSVLYPEEAGGLASGDLLLTWEDQPIRIPELVEFLADFGTVGGHVPVTYLREGTEQRTRITLVPFYPTPRFVLIIFFVGIITWIVAVIIAWKADPGIPAAVLHWTLIALSVTLLLTYGPISSDSLMSLLVRSIFVLSYPSIAVLFFYFTLLYPNPKSKYSRLTAALVFCPAMILVCGLWFTGTPAILEQSGAWFESFQRWFDLLHITLLVYTAGAVVSIVHTIRRSKTVEERQRMRRIVLGVLVGVGPFLFFVVFPQVCCSVYLIPEEYASICLLAIPYSFLMSLVRDRLLNVQFVVSRNLLSIGLKAIVTVIFILAVLMAVSLIPGVNPFREHLLLLIVTLGLALLFNPMRLRMQRIADEALFAARVRFRHSLGDIGENLQKSLSSQQVYDRLIEGLRLVVPSDALAVYRFSGRRSFLTIAASTTVVPPSVRVTGSLVEDMVTRDVYGLKGSLDSTRRDRELDELECLAGTGFSVCVPIVSDTHELLGAILIAPRGGRDRLQEEEIDLLVSLAREASEVLSRLRLQQRLILGEEEKRRIQELSELKSDFVSYVSHELFTPLTSMNMFTEFLAERMPARDRKSREYLRIIQGEVGRLARMVKTILNTARFDSGGSIFHRSPQDLGALASSVIESMRYQLEMHHFKLVTSFPKRELPIEADPEAVTLAISNLISNSIKYSPSRKALTVRVHKRGTWGVCEITDRGMGMTSEMLSHIFKKFYRAPTLEAHSKGVGLGLALVKQVIDGHHGRVDVRSAPNKGSTFTLWFPLMNSGKNSTETNPRRPAQTTRSRTRTVNRRRKR